MLLDQGRREAVVPGGDGGVGREDGHLRHVARRLAVGDAVALHLGADHLDRREGAMPFVQVEDRRVNPQRVEQPDAADAEQQLLADPHAGVAAVEPRGQRAVRLAVLGDVRVEQVERRPADRDLPGLRVERAGVRVDREPEPLAAGARHRLDRQHGDVGDRVGLLLPPLAVERLLEVPLGVEDADADERHAQVAGALQVVARQDAEAAGVDGQALVQAELHREVRDRARPQGRGVQGGPAVVVFQILREPAEPVVDPRVQGRLLGDGLELLGRDPGEELDRVMVRLVPELDVEQVEEREVVRLPGPPEVARQFPQLLDDFRLLRHRWPSCSVIPGCLARPGDFGVEGDSIAESPAGRQPRRGRRRLAATLAPLATSQGPTRRVSWSRRRPQWGDRAMADNQGTSTAGLEQVSTVDVAPTPTPPLDAQGVPAVRPGQPSGPQGGPLSATRAPNQGPEPNEASPRATRPTRPAASAPRGSWTSGRAATRCGTSSAGS